jgi:HSP20 family protein
MTTTNTPPPTTEVRRRTPWVVEPWPALTPWGTQLQSLMQQLWPSELPASDFSPGGDLHETDEAFVLELELPGVDRKDITIDVSGRRVGVHGTKTTTERTGMLRHSTRTSGTFAYEAVLPVPVEESAVTAALGDGVLTVTLPKATASKPTRIEIH